MEEVTDLTEPDLDRISRRAGLLLEEFKELVYPEGYDPDKPAAKRKVRSHFAKFAKKYCSLTYRVTAIVDSTNSFLKVLPIIIKMLCINAPRHKCGAFVTSVVRRIPNMWRCVVLVMSFY